MRRLTTRDRARVITFELEEGTCVSESRESPRLDQRRGFIIDTSSLNERSGLLGLVALGATDRQAYFVEGEEVGRGSDGEPLLKVEHIWPVPRDTNITCLETFGQKALRLWSSGPCDGSGERHLDARLGREDSPYIPEGMPAFNGTFMPPHAGGRRKPADKEKRRQQKQARKKQRAAKKR